MKSAGALLCAAAIFGGLTACQTGDNSNKTSKSVEGLYMTDTYSGKVYVYNPSKHKAGSTSLVSTGQNSTGPISFYKGVGYIAVGSYNNTAPGVYCFNPSDSNPTAVQVGDDVSAQYVAFYGATKAYVSVASYGSTGGVYTFDPSNTDAGLSGPIANTDAADLYLQQIVVGPDGMVYVANNSNNGGTDEVLQIDPATDTLTSTTFAASASGTTALASGSYNGSTGVFVGNITYGDTGSLDFIDTSATTPSISQVIGSVDVSRIQYLSTDKLVTTSYTHSYIVSGLSTGSPTKTELGSGLGGTDLALKDSLIYVGYTDYTTSKLYVFDAASGTAKSYSPVSIMKGGEAVAGLGFYKD